MADNDDAQRVMEQKALHNVRGLVEKLEASDEVERTTQKRILIGFAIVLAVLGGLWAAGIVNFGRGDAAKEIVVAPVKAPQK